MKLAFAVLALLCLSSVHATGIPKLEVTKSNEGIKSPEVTVKLPSITVGIPKVNVSGVMDAMPKMKLPKIDMPSVSVNMQTPSFDMSALQGLISAAMNKPSMNLTGLASMMQMPSVNMAGLASLLQKPSVDMSGLVALLTKSGNGSISIPGIPQITSSFNAADIVVNLIKAIKSALPTVDTATALKVVEAISAQMSKPGLDINIPMKSIPDFNISTPQIDLTPLASLFKAHPMPQINIDESQITALTNMLIQKPVNMTNHVLDGMVALANKASSMPQVDLSGLQSLLQKPNLSVDLSGLAGLLQKPNIDLSQIVTKTNFTLPEITALATFWKPNIDLSGLQSMLSTLLAKPSNDLAVVTSAINSLIASKPNITMPDLTGVVSALMAKPSLSISVPDVASHLFNKPGFNMTDIALLGGLLNKPGMNLTMPDLTLLQVALNKPKEIAAIATTVANITGMVLTDNLKSSAIVSLLQHATNLHTASNTTMPTGQVVVDMSGVSDAVSSAKTAVSAGVSSAAKTGAAAKAAAAKAVADGAMSAKDGMNTASKTMQDGVNSAVAAHSKKSKTN